MRSQRSRARLSKFRTISAARPKGPDPPAPRFEVARVGEGLPGATPDSAESWLTCPAILGPRVARDDASSARALESEDAQEQGLSEQTLYVWRKRLGGAATDEVKRLKALETENARFMKLLAERDLEVEVMKEIAEKMVSAPVRREQVTYAVKRGLSLRRAYAPLSVARSSLRDESRLRANDAPVLATIRACAELGPWAGVRLPSDPAQADERVDRHGVHRPGKTLAERNGRGLQRPVSRRVPEHGMVSNPRRGGRP